MSYFDLYDINFSLVKREPYIVNSGKKINHTIKPIEINTKYRDHFLRYKKEKDYGDHAFLIRTSEDLKSMISDATINVKLSVMGRHGLTNLTRIVHQEFSNVDQIKNNKEFKFGKSLDIV